VARLAGRAEQATLLVHGVHVPVAAAALANGTASFSHNFTDTTLSCVIHGGPVAVPAALAVGELVHASGADVLTAVVAGYEVMTRVGNAINAGSARMAHHRKGFHPTATCGIFGAAALAAKMLGVGADITVQALGVAGSFASGLAQSLADGSDAWRAHGGVAAHNGVLSALLAREGLTAPVAILDGVRGVCTAFTNGTYDAPALTADLGTRFLVLDAAFKLHNVAHVWALPLDALAILRERHAFAATDVDRMTVTFPKNWTAIMDDPTGATFAPANYAQATNNLRFCLAVGLHAGRVHLDEFDEKHLRDPAILETARRVEPRPDADLGAIFETTDKAPVRLDVTLRSGVTHTLDVEYPRGCPQNPATRDEILAKFRALAVRALPADQLERVEAAVLDLEDLRDIGTLMSWLQRRSTLSRGAAS
jgi:2-methylcitrate dehydratase PrpD